MVPLSVGIIGIVSSLEYDLRSTTTSQYVCGGYGSLSLEERFKRVFDYYITKPKPIQKDENI